MQKLYITYAESRRLYGSDSYNTPSRFIREIPQDLIQEVRLRSSVSRPLSSRFAGGPSRIASESGYALGQRVLHQIFGEGIILNVEGNGPSTRVQVNFDREGSKWLVLQYAKLEALS
jgi:DNA helicase-2/ATP-dependent DNA helicase PcrA